METLPEEHEGDDYLQNSFNRGSMPVARQKENQMVGSHL